jgi:hypothetical protein
MSFTEHIFKTLFNDPNFLGEALLSYCFVGDGRGCYSNFEVNPSFKKGKHLREEFAVDFLGEEFEDEDLDSIHVYTNIKEDITLAWHWYGDGHLIFVFGNIQVENTDVKKDYTWKFIK